MCKSQTEGGQRCAAHTRPIFLRVHQALERAEERGLSYEIGRAQEQWDVVAANHAATPSGHKELTEMLDFAESRQRPVRAAALRNALAAGDRIRDAEIARRRSTTPGAES